MDSNSINIYPKENSTTSGSTSESTQQPNPRPEDTTQGEASQTRTTEIEMVVRVLKMEILIKLQKMEV